MCLIQRPPLHCPHVSGVSQRALSNALPGIARTDSWPRHFCSQMLVFGLFMVLYPTPFVTLPACIPYGARDTSAAKCLFSCFQLLHKQMFRSETPFSVHWVQHNCLQYLRHLCSQMLLFRRFGFSVKGMCCTLQQPNAARRQLCLTHLLTVPATPLRPNAYFHAFQLFYKGNFLHPSSAKRPSRPTVVNPLAYSTRDTSAAKC